MNKIGLKITDKSVSYETFETLGYLLEYEFEYEDMIESVKLNQIIKLDMDETEDIEVLNSLLLEVAHMKVGYKLYHLLDEKWIEIQIENLSFDKEESCS